MIAKGQASLGPGAAADRAPHLSGVFPNWWSESCRQHPLQDGTHGRENTSAEGEHAFPVRSTPQAAGVPGHHGPTVRSDVAEFPWGVANSRAVPVSLPVLVSWASLPALEARSLGWRCRGVTLPLVVLREGPSRLCQLLGAAGVPWLVAISLRSLHLHMAFLQGHQSFRAHPTSV